MQELTEADRARVERDLDCLGMTSRARPHQVVVGGLGFPSGVAGDGADDAVDVLEDALHTPEAPSRQDCDLGLGAGRSLVHIRRRNHPAIGR